MAVMKTWNGTSWVPVNLGGNGTKLGKELLINRDIINAVNQRNFDGNWYPKTIGHYGYDRWLKADSASKGQIVEAGSFVVDKLHTLSYSLAGEIIVTTLTSPSSGHWLVKVPFAADNLSLRKGDGYSEFEPERPAQRDEDCSRYYTTSHGNIHWMTHNGTPIYTFNPIIQFITMMRARPELQVTYNGGNVNLQLICIRRSGFDFRNNNFGTGSLDKYIQYVADAELKLSDVGL